MATVFSPWAIHFWQTHPYNCGEAAPGGRKPKLNTGGGFQPEPTAVEARLSGRHAASRPSLARLA